MACLPLLAAAEGKCDDDPFWVNAGRTKLGVTWTIPVPDGTAGVDQTSTLMADLDARAPVEPPDFPAEYAANVWKTDYPDGPAVNGKPEKLDTPAKHGAFLNRFGLKRDPAASPITDDYFNKGRVFFGAVVGHPPIPSPVGYELCTCILQRAVLLWDDKARTEHLWLRSRFRSAKKDKRNWANFEPAAPVKVVFPSATIWFPLAYNRVLPESPAFLVLDVLTRARLAFVPGFTNEYLGQLSYALGAGPAESWHLVRLRARYPTDKPPDDLSVVPQ